MNTHKKILKLLDQYHEKGVDQGVEETIMCIAEGLADYQHKSKINIKKLMNKWMDYYNRNKKR